MDFGNSNEPNLIWMPEIEAAVKEWQITYIFPFPSMGISQAPTPHLYVLEDLRLIYHVASIYSELAAIEANGFTLWTEYIPTLISIGTTNNHAMQALLGFSAMHIESLADNSLRSMVYKYRAAAMTDLRQSIEAFCRDTSHAILAMSILLYWQNIDSDWRTFTQLSQGISSIINSMDAWKHESQFANYIVERTSVPVAIPVSPEKEAGETLPEYFEGLGQTIEKLQKVEDHLKNYGEDETQIHGLIDLLRRPWGLRRMLMVDEQFEHFRLLRMWLFWMPVDLVHRHHGSVNSLIIIAYLYTVALLIARLFPDIRSTTFGECAALRIELIAQRISAINISETSIDKFQDHIYLMEFPVETVAQYRTRQKESIS